MALTKRKSLLRPLIELLIAAVFWGFGFVATIWSLPFLSPSAIIAYRFLTAFVVGAFALPFLNLTKTELLNEFKLSAAAGLLLGLCLFLQTVGLQYTTATNSAFITTLYVIIVPLVARLFMNHKLYFFHWLSVAIALVGTAMIVKLSRLELNLGDSYTLVCAVVASLQIVYISWISKKSKDPFALNTFQSLWAGAPFLIMLGPELELGKWNLFALNVNGWIGMLSLTFGSTLLAFYLQLKVQKELKPSLASLLYLLESPFSCLFAVILLKETLELSQYLGALLIVFACLLATWFENKHPNEARDELEI